MVIASSIHAQSEAAFYAEAEEASTCVWGGWSLRSIIFFNKEEDPFNPIRLRDRCVRTCSRPARMQRVLWETELQEIDCSSPQLANELEFEPERTKKNFGNFSCPQFVRPLRVTSASSYIKPPHLISL